MNISKVLLILIIVAFAATVTFGQEIEVTDDQNMSDAIAFVAGGGANTIILATDGGVYYTSPIDIEVPLTIKAKAGLAVKPTLVTQGTGAGAFISVREDLMLDGIIINGYDGATSTYDSVKYAIQVKADSGSVNEQPTLIIKNCMITNTYRDGDPEFSKDGTILDFTKGARAGTVLIENCMFSNTGDEALRSINTHKDPVPQQGVYCNSFVVRNCTFSNVRGTGIKIEGDGDSTNVDPQVVMENLTFDGCQKRVIWHRDMFGTVVRNILITNSIKGNDDWEGARALITVQSLGTTVTNIDTFNCAGIKANGDTVSLAYGTIVAEIGTNTGATRTATFDESTIYNFDPGYADAANGDYTLAAGSPLLGLGHDGYAIGDRNWSGQLGDPVSVESDLTTIPENFTLSQNYPNPFNPTTNIKFSLPSSGNYTLKIFNLLGQEVATLIDGDMVAGIHTVNFDASRLASGIYFYNFNGNNFNQTKKMILLK